MTSTYDQCFLFVVLASRVFAIRILSPRIVFICLLDRHTVMFCSIPCHHLSNYTIVQRLLPRSTPLAVLRHHRELYSEECKYTTFSQRYNFSSLHTACSSSSQSVSPFLHPLSSSPNISSSIWISRHRDLFQNLPSLGLRH